MPSETFNMVAPPDVYRQRRARLAATIRRPMVIFAGRGRPRNYTANIYPYRAGSTYLYFGGPPLEGAAWLIEPGSDGDAGCTLRRTPAGIDDVVWTGEPPSDAAIAAVAGIAESSLTQPDALASLLRGRNASCIYPPCVPTLLEVQSLGLHLAEPDEQLPIIDMRLVKDAHELGAMRRAADVGVQAQLSAMRACCPGVGEADVVAAWTATVSAHQFAPSFTPIVTVHGEVLHTESYSHELRAGQLLLVDAGTEEPGGYASDITRTYPVNGRWTTIQRQLYDTVLRAEQTAIAACLPGRRYRDIHDLAAHVVCEGLVDAELLRGNPAELAERRAHTLFFVHGVGHLIGLDVHDMEDFGDLAGYAPGRTRRTHFGDKFLRLDRDLLPGMAVTIEPGIYLVPAIWEKTDWPAPFSDAINRRLVNQLLEDGFGGIRIEETVVVQGRGTTGPEVLTAALPNDADQVARLIGSK